MGFEFVYDNFFFNSQDTVVKGNKDRNDGLMTNLESQEEDVPIRSHTVGNSIDKKMLSTINKILIDKFSIRSFCY